MKKYNVKYNISDTVYVNIPKIGIVNGIIDSFRIIENKECIKIHYLIVLNKEIQIEPGVYKNFEWFDEKDINILEEKFAKNLENIN